MPLTLGNNFIAFKILSQSSLATQLILKCALYLCQGSFSMLFSKLKLLIVFKQYSLRILECFVHLVSLILSGQNKIVSSLSSETIRPKKSYHSQYVYAGTFIILTIIVRIYGPSLVPAKTETERGGKYQTCMSSKRLTNS